MARLSQPFVREKSQWTTATSSLMNSEHKKPATAANERKSVGCFKRILHLLFGGWWAMELFAAGFSILATGALVVILYFADDNPNFQLGFGTRQISLNVVVAIMATIIRATLLFAVGSGLAQMRWNWFAARKRDKIAAGRPLRELVILGDAASGSLGCVKLLWLTKGCRLPALGALVVLLLLPFDAFTQQVLSIRTIPIVSNAAASSEESIPSVSTMFSNDVATPQQWSSFNNIGNLRTLPNDTDTVVAPIDATCPTRDCTWPIIPTLGICSECQDIGDTSSLIFDGAQSTWTYQVPGRRNDGPTGQPNYYLTNSINGFAVANYGLNMTNLTTIDTYASGDGNSTEFLIFYYIGMPPTALDTLEGLQPNVSSQLNLLITPTVETNTTWLNTNVTLLDSTTLAPLIHAHRCSLSLCVQAYNLSTTGGEFQQELIGTSQDAHFDFDVIPDVIQFQNIPESFNVHNTSAFWASALVPALLANQVPNVLDQNLGFDFLGSSTFFGSMHYPNASHAVNFASLLWQASNTTEDLSAAFAVMANSTSQYLRTVFPTEPDSYYAATAYLMVPVNSVTWTWLILPILSVVLGVIFLILTILDTRHLNLRPWKAALLPLLLAQPDHSLHQLSLDGYDEKDALVDRVGDVRVRLRYVADEGVKFVGS